MNKAALEAEVARLKQLSTEDERRRREFAKAFGWLKRQSYGDPEPLTPTWEQVFTELGKLLASQRTLTYITDVESLKLDIREAKLLIEDLRHPQDAS